GDGADVPEEAEGAGGLAPHVVGGPLRERAAERRQGLGRGEPEEAERRARVGAQLRAAPAAPRDRAERRHRAGVLEEAEREAGRAAGVGVGALVLRHRAEELE